MKWKKCLGIITVTAMVIGTAAYMQVISAEAKEGQQNAYKLMKENDNPDLSMHNQPESSYWFPKQLLEWNAKEDHDLDYNVSVVPLAKRVDMAKLKTVNPTQNRNTKVMAISIMNSSTSGNAPRGLNNVDANTFSYWQYTDILVYWGGSSGEGIIVPPSPDVVDAGHKNGVKVIGTIFFPQTGHGGKMEWLNEFLQKDDSGKFPMADKLIEVAKTYGFDGWFLNQETEGTDQSPLSVQHADLTREFIKAIKKKAPELELIYYDSMTKDGNLDWQNALTDKNLPFMKDDSGTKMSDAMFLNFWWTDKNNEKKELLKNSAKKAREIGIDPYSLYAGVDIQSDGYNTPIRWDLFENPEGGTYTSLGLYCPNWAYSSADSMTDFLKKENSVWVNEKGDPSAGTGNSSNTAWKGISHYAIERTSITALPFVTNFNTGNGYYFFKDGKKISSLGWNNRSISDILPTYRYIIKNDGKNSLKADLDMKHAYYGGSSLKLMGNMEKDKNTLIKLYSTDLNLKKGVIFTTTAKASSPAFLKAVVTLEDGTEKILDGDKKVSNSWTEVAFDISSIYDKHIRSISYLISTEQDSSNFKFYFGNITIAERKKVNTPSVKNVTVENPEFDEDALYAGVRLSWKTNQPAAFYEICQVNSDQTKSLLGVTNTTNFYINALPRTGDADKTVLEITPVTALLENGSSSQTTLDWPDITIPKAEFKADVTLAAPGDSITFTSMCSKNTDRVIWSLPGAEKESAEGSTVSAKYNEEGIYPVTITADNKSGSSQKVKEGYIVITNKAKDGLKLLSQGCKTEATSYVNENESPNFAVDGDKTKKWCAAGKPPYEIVIDLGEAKLVSAVDISHAEAGGESSDMNTKEYSILVSNDGLDYTEAAKITQNTSGLSHDTFTPTKARYIKIIINKPTQGSDSAARIYEVEIYGL